MVLSWGRYQSVEFVFERAFYSVPFRLVGQQVRGGKHEVRISTKDCELIATHRHVWGERATRCKAGQRSHG
jgi:hypothetical protein